MVMRIGAVLLAAMALGPVAQAQQIVGGYYTVIGPRDFFDPTGRPHHDLCHVLRQDRENFHHFGIRDVGDEDDPFFVSPAARAGMDNCRVLSRAHRDVSEDLRAFRSRAIYVEIIMWRGRIDEIRFGAGRRPQPDGDQVSGLSH